MSATLGGLPLVDPDLFRQSCLDRGLPLDPWFGRANSFRCPLGRGPGTGHVLISRGALDSLDTARPMKLVFGDDAGTVTLQKVWITRAVCVSPGYESDPSAAYLLSLADVRAFVPQDRAVQYNIRSDDGTGWAPASTYAGGGTPYTWQQLADAVWKPAYNPPAPPTLPFAPEGTPNHFDYAGLQGWEAYHHLLDRLACRLRYDPISPASTATVGTLAANWSVVRWGVANSAADRVVAALRPYLVWSDHRRPAAPEPATVRVVYRLAPRDQFLANPSLDATYNHETAANAGGTVSVQLLWDDLVSVYGTAGATWANAADRTNRAAERVSDYLRCLRLTPKVNVYEGVRPEALTALGSQWSEVAWHDRGLGWQTELARDDFASVLRAWRPAGELGRPAAIFAAAGTAQTIGSGAVVRVTPVIALSGGFVARYLVRAWWRGVAGSGGLTGYLSTTDSGGTTRLADLYTTPTAASGATLRDSCETVVSGTGSTIYLALFMAGGVGTSTTSAADPGTNLFVQPVDSRGVGP